MSNTLVYAEEWKTKLQEKLDEDCYYENICRVEYTSSKVIHNPYRGDATATSYTRGAQYTYNDFTVTDETIDINLSFVSPEFIDRADLAQTGFNLQMEMAERQAVALKERVETSVLGVYTQAGITINDGDLKTASNGGTTNPIALSSTNVAEVVRIIRRKIVKNAGRSMLNRQGGFVIWSPEDYELVMAYLQSTGNVVADRSITEGNTEGTKFGGFSHYESNLLTDASNVRHILAGINKNIHLGILNTTYGDVMVDNNDPDNRSGVSIVSRVDYNVKVWSQVANTIADVQIKSD